MNHRSARPTHLFLWIVSLFLAANLSAKTVYISQSGAGSANGTSATNAHAVTWLNTSGNWGSGTSQINPGDTIMLEGAITSPITISASGTSGHVTTLLFDTGAYMSAPYWPNGQSGYMGWNNVGNIKQGAITAAFNISYFTIDGGTTGYIECTSNGQNLSTQTQWDCAGIFLQSPQNVTVQNLIIRNMYVRTAHSEPDLSDSTTAPGTGSYGVSIACVDRTTPVINTRITNCVMHDMASGVLIAASGATTGFQIDHCTIYNVNFGTGGGVYPAGSSISNSSFHDNWVYGFSAWDDTNAAHTNPYEHHDGIFWWAQTMTSGNYDQNTVVTGTRIYNNKFGPDYGVCTNGAVTEQGYFTNELIYNNIFVSDSAVPARFIYLDPYVTGCSARVMNNTFVGTGPGLPIDFDGVTGGSATYWCYNNLMVNESTGIAVFHSAAVTLNCDYNLYYNISSHEGSSSTSSSAADFSWAAWKALGYDTHGVTGTNPNLAASTYALTGSSTAAIDKGTSESTYFTTDYIGTTRPQGSAWDIGAYEYITTAATPPPATTTPVISSLLTASAAVGTSFTYTITASNSPTSFSASPLPAGLSVNTSTGVISGTTTTAGITNVTIGATNAAGTGSATLALTAAIPPNNAKISIQ